MNIEKQGVNLGIYAVYDKISKIYDTPFFARDDVFARRRFIMWTQEEHSMLHDFKPDFELHRLGSFNPQDGSLIIAQDIICEGDQIVSNNGND